MGLRFLRLGAVCLAVFASGCAEQTTLPITIAISPQFTAIATDGTVQFSVVGGNNTTDVTWTATAGVIDSEGDYLAPTGTQSAIATVTATSKKDATKSATATIHLVAPGQVSPTANAQVALYSISPGAAGNISVEFGPDANYGLTTWMQPVPASGGAVNMFIAGMKANTLYHIRGLVQFSDGAQFTDADQTFVTGTIPPIQLTTMQVTTTPGMTPQSGLEVLDMVPGVTLASTPATPPVVADLNGNVLWSYNSGLTGVIANPIKLLPNGHFLINYSGGPGGDGANSVLQEVDLTGALIWQMTATDLNAALAAATCAGCNIKIVGTHHDFVMLPNGHLIVIASTLRVISGTTVTGDAIIDLDQDHKPVWLWNEFDHLDVNRRPLGFPDWTHTNAVIYSTDDGNLIISVRHQNWLVKVDYANGTGAGDILWKLGYQGDFALVGGTDPTDWFYAQRSCPSRS